MNIFIYVTSDDSSAAPNFSGPSATFAMGQPEIRRLAQPGDVVLGCSGGEVRWVGRVAEKLSYAAYWDDPRFRGKRPGLSSSPDNIYRWAEGDLARVGGDGVRDARHVVADLAGRFVLVFAESWQVRDSSAALPASLGIDLAHLPDIRPVCRALSRGQWWGLRDWLGAPSADAAEMPIGAIADAEAIFRPLRLT